VWHVQISGLPQDCAFRPCSNSGWNTNCTPTCDSACDRVSRAVEHKQRLILVETWRLFVCMSISRSQLTVPCCRVPKAVRNREAHTAVRTNARAFAAPHTQRPRRQMVLGNTGMRNIRRIHGKCLLPATAMECAAQRRCWHAYILCVVMVAGCTATLTLATTFA
jgi:hypothetical protein